MAQTQFKIKVPRSKSGPDLSLSAELDIHRCECGRCKNFVLSLKTKEDTTGFQLPPREIVLPLSVTDFLVTQIIGIMAAGEVQ